MKKRVKHKKIAFFAALALCVAAILPLSGCAWAGSFASGASSSMLHAPDPGRGSASPHFYLDGNLYTYSGRYASTLPEGFEFIKEVENCRLSSGEPAVDFSGNFAGEIYMSESETAYAYVKMRSGEVYLRFPLRNIHFFFGGEKYVRTDTSFVYTVPAGFLLAGEVQTVGEAGADFSGNLAGYIYMSESDKTAAYFRFKNWNEAIDGKEQYLKMEPEK